MLFNYNQAYEHLVREREEADWVESHRGASTNR